MMRKVLKGTWLIVLVVVITSCSKYEDGPFISLLPRQMRLVNKWKIEKYYKDGVEQALSDDDKKGYIDIKKDKTLEEVAYSGSFSITMRGTWAEVDNYSKIKINITDPFSVEYEYTILRLMNNQLWLKEVSGSHEYEYHYVSY